MDDSSVGAAPQGAEWALRERVKELTCLYGIAQVAERSGAELDRGLAEIVALLPTAWAHPSIAVAGIALDGRRWETGPFDAVCSRQSCAIAPAGVSRGCVELGYREPRPAADEGPFLREERDLIQEVARQLGILVERHEAERERERLREQLWRSERMGMIGRLAAGLAHELNEPLGSILGYAQLAQRSFGLPDQTGRDLDRIVKASLHARDIVRKLLVFARQAPERREPVEINRMIEESLFLLENRCRRAGVKIGLRLERDLPPVSGDRSLLQQAFLNLAVNGIQAMPSGGRLTVRTEAVESAVQLVVEDTGAGMPAAVLQRCFDPFYTTRDVGQGTGMGLAVTHGIVTSHGGTIEASSAPGKGSRFTIRLPRPAAATETGGA